MIGVIRIGFINGILLKIGTKNIENIHDLFGRKQNAGFIFRSAVTLMLIVMILGYKSK